MKARLYGAGGAAVSFGDGQTLIDLPPAGGATASDEPHPNVEIPIFTGRGLGVRVEHGIELGAGPEIELRHFRRTATIDPDGALVYRERA